ncbi:MAG: TetR/AcrR family transcriptional regulator [Rubrivivax sp.]
MTPSRVRRDSAEAQDELRRAAIDAALLLFAGGGLGAVSMRAVAQACGVTPMALYRYFDGKDELLLALWDHVLQGLAQALAASDQAASSAAARMRSSLRVFIVHWEHNPEHYKLVFSGGSALVGSDPRVTGGPVYQGLLASSAALLRDYAREQGLPEDHVLLARDLRHAMVMGYLHARLVNLRYPWSNLDALREATIDAVLLAVTACLRGPASMGA